MKSETVSTDYYNFTVKILLRLRELRRCSTDQRKLSVANELIKLLEDFEPEIMTVRGNVGSHSKTKPNLEQTERRMK